MDSGFRINYEGAIFKAKSEGKADIKKEISAQIWPDSNENTRAVSLSKLITGKWTGTPDNIRVVKNLCGVSYDFLFNENKE